MTDQDPKAARPPRGERARLIIDVATWCYLGASLAVAFNVWRLGQAPLGAWAVSLAVPSAAVILGAVLLIAGGDVRARSEEKVLTETFGDRYREYMQRVSRAIPGVY